MKDSNKYLTKDDFKSVAFLMILIGILIFGMIWISVNLIKDINEVCIPTESGVQSLDECPDYYGFAIAFQVIMIIILLVIASGCWLVISSFLDEDKER